MVREEYAKSLEGTRARMRWEVIDGDFALLGFPDPPGVEDLTAILDSPAQLVREGGETTLLVRQEHLAQLLARHRQVKVERDLCWIRFQIPMSWDLVGFLALVTGELAREGIPLGAVCGYSRDHLFLARRFMEPARAVLSRLFPSARADDAPEA